MACDVISHLHSVVAHVRGDNLFTGDVLLTYIQTSIYGVAYENCSRVMTSGILSIYEIYETDHLENQ